MFSGRDVSLSDMLLCAHVLMRQATGRIQPTHLTVRHRTLGGKEKTQNPTFVIYKTWQIFQQDKQKEQNSVI
jgi:hypothetical protein